MTEESRQKVRLRGFKTRIFAISFSACLITVMIVAALSLSGESPGIAIPTCANNVPLIMQCGQQNILIPIGSVSGTSTFTFSPAFANIPRGETTMMGSAASFTRVESLLFGSATFIAVESTGQTWNPVPAAITEVFGDVGQHRIVYQTTVSPNPFASTTSASFSVACSSIVSITGTEFLRPQWYDGSIATWESVSSTTTGLDWVWGIGGNCPYALGTNSVSSNVNSSLTKNINTLIPLRVVGGNGDGVTSTITIEQISLQFYGNISMRPICSMISISKTQIIVSADYLFPIVSNPNSVPCQWKAITT